jgi:hypothetical protein
VSGAKAAQASTVSDTDWCQAQPVPKVRLRIHAADAGFVGVGSLPLIVLEDDPIEVVMAPRKRSRTSIGRWAVLGSNQ